MFCLLDMYIGIHDIYKQLQLQKVSHHSVWRRRGGSLLLKSHCHIKSLCTRVHVLAPCFCSPQSPGHQPSGSVKETIPSQKLSSGLDFSTSYQCVRYMYACVPLGSQSLWQTKLCHGSLGLEVLISKRRLNHCLSLGQESFRKFCFWRCHFKHGNFC